MIKKGVLLLFILLLPIVYSADYYADLSINVDESGFVSIAGNTNYPEIIGTDIQKYTYKKQDYWLLNITLEQIFSDYVFSVSLPAGSSINYIKSSGNVRIEESSGTLEVKGFGQDKKLSIIVQYQIGKKNNKDIYFVILGVVLLLIFIFIIFKILKKNNKMVKEEIPEEGIEIKDYSGLSARQKEIVDLLLKNSKPMTQAQVQDLLKIPKASVSRNIRSLELKGIIQKEESGMTNIIKLKR